MRTRKIFSFLVIWTEIDAFILKFIKLIEISENIRNLTKWNEISGNIRNFTNWIQIDVNIRNFSNWIEICLSIRNFAKWMEICVNIRKSTEWIEIDVNIRKFTRRIEIFRWNASWNTSSKRVCSSLQASVLFRRVFSRQFPNIDHIYGLLGARVPKIPLPSLPGYLRLRFRS